MTAPSVDFSTFKRRFLRNYNYVEWKKKKKKKKKKIAMSVMLISFLSIGPIGSSGWDTIWCWKQKVWLVHADSYVQNDGDDVSIYRRPHLHCTRFSSITPSPVTGLPTYNMDQALSSGFFTYYLHHSLYNASIYYQLDHALYNASIY